MKLQYFSILQFYHPKDKAPLLITGNESYSYLSFINTTIADSIKNFGWKEPKGKQDRATIVKYAGFQDGVLQTEIKTLSLKLNNIDIQS